MQGPEAQENKNIVHEGARSADKMFLSHVGDAGAIGAGENLHRPFRRAKREEKKIAHIGDAGAVGAGKKLHRPRKETILIVDLGAAPAAQEEP